MARAKIAAIRDSPRTRQSSHTLAAFRPWGSFERWRHVGSRVLVYGTLGQIRQLVDFCAGYCPLFAHHVAMRETIIRVDVWQYKEWERPSGSKH